MANIYFECQKDKSHKFSLIKPANIEGVWHWRGVVKCPYCGAEDIQEDMKHISPTLPKRDMSQLRRENKDMTRQAQQMAAEAARNDVQNDPEVTLAPIQGAKKNEPLKIKKSILDSIESKKPEGYA